MSRSNRKAATKSTPQLFEVMTHQEEVAPVLSPVESSEEAESEEGSHDSSSDSESSSEEYYGRTIFDVIKAYNASLSPTFAIGGEIDVANHPIVHADGVGKISYPLSKKQAATLRSVSTQAPFGKGTETVVDVEVRRAWQVDSSLVHIDQKWLDHVLPKVVSACCTELGIDAAKNGVRANLYKMLLYEEGGHFKKHRDTEKEPGMFGSLLIQLPAEHQGGNLVVEHNKQTETFCFAENSKVTTHFAAFYADCEHTLEPVTKGLRLVLAFNLVRSVESSVPNGPSTSSQSGNFTDLLAAATQVWCEDETAVPKFALPLAHQYTRTNVSFAGLKGTDLSAATLLQNAAHPSTGDKLFRVYLALVTKHLQGVSNMDEVAYEYGCGEDGGPVQEGMNPNCSIETDFYTDTWVGPNGPVDLGKLKVNCYAEILTELDLPVDKAGESVFGAEPDKKEDEGYLGNYAGAVDYFYHSTLLVFWPVQKDFEITVVANPNEAAEQLRGVDRVSEEYTQKFGLLLAHITSGYQVTWQPAKVLPLVRTAVEAVSVLGLCAEMHLDPVDLPAVAQVVSEYGWSELDEMVIAVVKHQFPEVMVALLDLLEPLRAAPGDDDGGVEGKVPVGAWKEMVQGLVTEALDFGIYAAPVYYNFPKGGRKLNTTYVGWATVGRFVVTHCEAQQQQAVAGYLASKVGLDGLNYFLEQLRGLPDGSFQDLLRDSAVQRCVAKPQAEEDLTAVVEWVLHEGRADLLATLRPSLTTCKGLFTLPSVLQELKKDTPMSAELKALVQARITALEPQAAVPALSWRLPEDLIATSDPRVGSFLESDKQSTSLAGGFGGIPGARKWVKQHFGTTGTSPQGISGEAFGSGRSAGVKLTKLESAREAVVKRCAECAQEISALRKLLLTRGAEAAGVDAGSAVASGAGASGGRKKKAKVASV